MALGQVRDVEALVAPDGLGDLGAARVDRVRLPADDVQLRVGAVHARRERVARRVEGLQRHVVGALLDRDGPRVAVAAAVAVHAGVALAGERGPQRHGAGRDGAEAGAAFAWAVVCVSASARVAAAWPYSGDALTGGACAWAWACDSVCCAEPCG